MKETHFSSCTKYILTYFNTGFFKKYIKLSTLLKITNWATYKFNRSPKKIIIQRETLWKHSKYLTHIPRRTHTHTNTPNTLYYKTRDLLSVAVLRLQTTGHNRGSIRLGSERKHPRFCTSAVRQRVPNRNLIRRLLTPRVISAVSTDRGWISYLQHKNRYDFIISVNRFDAMIRRCVCAFNDVRQRFEMADK